MTGGVAVEGGADTVSSAIDALGEAVHTTSAITSGHRRMVGACSIPGPNPERLCQFM